MKVREVFRLLRKDGWYLVPSRGGHRRYMHATFRGRLTVSANPSNDLAPGMLNRILIQAGL